MDLKEVLENPFQTQKRKVDPVPGCTWFGWGTEWGYVEIYFEDLLNLLMILPEVHLQKHFYDVYFLYTVQFDYLSL